MPRRPRPVSRLPPKSAHNEVSSSLSKPDGKQKTLSAPAAPVASSSKVQLKPRRAVQTREESEDEGEKDEEDEDGSSDVDEVESGEEDEDLDADAPRIAQWVDEEELDLESSDSGDSDGGDDLDKPMDMVALQDGLSSLPFGTLRKAQKVLTREEANDNSDGEGSSSSSEPEQESTWTNRKSLGQPREKANIEKRKNKHAPMEMTSKKPVPRKKVEIEEQRPVPRDPRFLPIVGEFSAKRFQSQYGFLTSIHHEELSTLRDNLKRARKLLATSPKHLREEREAEVQKLERAVKRAESTVNRDRREKIEQEALERASKEEREKRKQGKGAWYMKKSDKKDLLVRAKYEALEADGGKGAVKKAIEKKQKKVNQKEKKRRPFGVGGEVRGVGGIGGQFGGHKRGRPGSADERVPNKRQRVS
ncbi:DUF947-domain-containing protein [Cristinia sonorae]|uniref:rRNA biogenesis protein RRP36 n=1 Tax=Cristinia sonorae TaxID=1940300 RepID=A0A8K0UQU2_9AGAR|nr:DUF947-domain-containing protein [Cristinia sonorae]